jgi:hypothetical protein
MGDSGALVAPPRVPSSVRLERCDSRKVNIPSATRGRGGFEGRILIAAR